MFQFKNMLKSPKGKIIMEPIKTALMEPVKTALIEQIKTDSKPEP